MYCRPAIRTRSRSGGGRRFMSAKFQPSLSIARIASARKRRLTAFSSCGGAPVKPCSFSLFCSVWFTAHVTEDCDATMSPRTRSSPLGLTGSPRRSRSSCCSSWWKEMKPEEENIIFLKKGVFQEEMIVV